MYQQLPVGPPGPIVRGPTAALLRGVLRLFNVVLAAVGLVLLATAAVLGLQYKHSGSGGGGGGGGEPLQLAGLFGPPRPAAGLLAGPTAVEHGLLVAAAAGQQGGGAVEEGWAWPIWATGGLGLYLLAAAASGLSGGRGVDSRRTLAGYIAALALLIVVQVGRHNGGLRWCGLAQHPPGLCGCTGLSGAGCGSVHPAPGGWVPGRPPTPPPPRTPHPPCTQAGAMLLLLTDNAWRAQLPPDPSGCWPAAQAFIQANGQAVRVACLAAAGAELLALGAASWLHSIYVEAYEAWLDDTAERQERAAVALDRAAAAAYSGQGPGGGAWASRLQHKYGLSRGAVEANANAARQVAALQDDAL